MYPKGETAWHGVGMQALRFEPCDVFLLTCPISVAELLCLRKACMHHVASMYKREQLNHIAC